MTEKRFEVTFNDSDFHLSDNETGEELKLVDEKVYYDYIANRWNALHEENNELRLMLNSCSDQRNEFHRGARENANRVGKLERENEWLKQYKQSVSDVLLSWSQKNLTAKQLQVVIAIMEELNILGDVE